MRLYLDANVIIYAVEGKDEALRTAARAWLVEGSKSGAEFTTSMFSEFECHIRDEIDELRRLAAEFAQPEPQTLTTA